MKVSRMFPDTAGTRWRMTLESRGRQSEEYREYLKSDRWMSVRIWAFRLFGRRCQMCGATDRLQIHHRNYTRLGHEWPDDVMVLCPKCHEKADAARAAGIARLDRKTGDRQI